MRVFNEEGSKKAEIVLVLEGTDARDIVEALEVAIKDRPRKSKWKTLHKKLDDWAAAY